MNFAGPLELDAYLHGGSAKAWTAAGERAATRASLDAASSIAYAPALAALKALVSAKKAKAAADTAIARSIFVPAVDERGQLSKNPDASGSARAATRPVSVIATSSPTIRQTTNASSDAQPVSASNKDSSKDNMGASRSALAPPRAHLPPSAESASAAPVTAVGAAVAFASSSTAALSAAASGGSQFSGSHRGAPVIPQALESGGVAHPPIVAASSLRGLSEGEMGANINGGGAASLHAATSAYSSTVSVVGAKSHVADPAPTAGGGVGTGILVSVTVFFPIPAAAASAAAPSAPSPPSVILSALLDSSSVARVIAAACAAGEAAGIPGVTGQDAHWELRLHDEDGMPDLDFPSLDSSRAISNFMGSGAGPESHVYCLTRMTGTGASNSDVSPSPAPNASASSVRNGNAISPPSLTLPPAVRVTLLTSISGAPPIVTMVSLAQPSIAGRPPIANADARVQDIIETLARRHRLPVHFEKFFLRVPAAASGGGPHCLLAPGTELNPSDNIQSLHLESAELLRRVYADDPPNRRAMSSAAIDAASAAAAAAGAAIAMAAPRTQLHSSSTAAENDAGHDVGARHSEAYYDAGDRDHRVLAHDQLPHDTEGSGQKRVMSESSMVKNKGRTMTTNTVSTSASTTKTATAQAHRVDAAALAAAGDSVEWIVKKTNRHGIAQDRILGIDLTRIVNRRLPSTGIFSGWVSSATVTGERLIADIASVSVPSGDPTAFIISVWNRTREGRRPGDTTSVPYAARTPREREEILEKLKALLELTGEAGKIIRAGL